jgi:hypothetical protein
VQRAFERVAEELKLPDVQAVTQLVGDIANELAFIEALRDRFLRRVQSMCQRIAAIAKGVVSQDRKMLLTRIDRLATLALDQIAGRFGLVDAQTGEVLSTLRNAAVHSGYIRSHRDWLYKSSRAWETILAEWDASAMPGLDDATWARLNRTYHFLAPRFMPVQEWFSAEMQAKARQKQNTPGRTWMVW